MVRTDFISPRMGRVQIIWMPPAKRSLQVRLMVCAHMHDAQHVVFVL